MTNRNPDYVLFCDSSFDPESKRGIGGSLLLSRKDFSSQIVVSDLKVRTKLFADMTNTRLELTTVLWALRQFKNNFHRKNANRPYYPDVRIVSDCKTIEDLPSRRDRLEKCAYKSNRTGELLSNADLYKKYFLLYAEIKPEIIRVKGHSASRQHTIIQRLFSHVDKATRAELRALKTSLEVWKDK